MGRPRIRALQAPRRQGSLETNLCRKGIYGADGAQLTLPIDSHDLLGAVRASGHLRIDPDLDLLIWLTERWREVRPTPATSPSPSMSSRRTSTAMRSAERIAAAFARPFFGCARRRSTSSVYHSVTGEAGRHVSSWETLLDPTPRASTT